MKLPSSTAPTHASPFCSLVAARLPLLSVSRSRFEKKKKKWLYFGWQWRPNTTKRKKDGWNEPTWTPALSSQGRWMTAELISKEEQKLPVLHSSLIRNKSNWLRLEADMTILSEIFFSFLGNWGAFFNCLIRFPLLWYSTFQNWFLFQPVSPQAEASYSGQYCFTDSISNQPFYRRRKIFAPCKCNNISRNKSSFNQLYFIFSWIICF